MSKNEHNERHATHRIWIILFWHQWWDISTGWWRYYKSSDTNMRNERFKNLSTTVPRISDKKDRGKTTLLKKTNILQATNLKYGPIHSAYPKPMWTWMNVRHIHFLSMNFVHISRILAFNDYHEKKIGVQYPILLSNSKNKTKQNKNKAFWLAKKLKKD